MCGVVLKLLSVHRYSVDVFSYSGPTGILGSDRKQNTTEASKNTTALIAHLVGCAPLQQEVLGSNPKGVQNGTSCSLADACIKRGCARKIE